MTFARLRLAARFGLGFMLAHRGLAGDARGFALSAAVTAAL